MTSPDFSEKPTPKPEDIAEMVIDLKPPPTPENIAELVVDIFGPCDSCAAEDKEDVIFAGMRVHQCDYLPDRFYGVTMDTTCPCGCDLDG